MCTINIIVCSLFCVLLLLLLLSALMRSTSDVGTGDTDYDYTEQPTRFSSVLAGTGWLDDVKQMQDSSDLLHQLLDSSTIATNRDRAVALLRARFDRDGFLLLKRMIPVHNVAMARAFLLQTLRDAHVIQPRQQAEQVTEAYEPLHDLGLLHQHPDDHDDTDEFSLLRRQDIAHQQVVLDVLEHQNMVDFVSHLFGAEQVRAIDFKWLRAVKEGCFTGIHTGTCTHTHTHTHTPL
jgi:hypothetical protein